MLASIFGIVICSACFGCIISYIILWKVEIVYIQRYSYGVGRKQMAKGQFKRWKVKENE